MKKQIIISTVVMLLAFSSCALVGSRETSKEEYPIASTVGSIHLSGYNGAITWKPIDSTDQAVVVVEKEVRGSLGAIMKKFLVGITIEDHGSASEMVLKATHPKRILGVTTSEVRFTVYASPDQIWRFRAQTSNGAIRIDADFDGLLDLRTSNGSIILRSGTGGVTLRTSNGSIDLGSIRFTESSSVRTSNGRIEGTVSFPQSGTFTFENSNGPVDLRMPDDTLGTFDVSTSNGMVDFRLGHDVVTKQRKAFVTRGSCPCVRIKTSNGNVTVQEWGYGF